MFIIIIIVIIIIIIIIIREFRDAIKLQYDWPIEDIPTRCVCGDIFSVDHSVVCKKGGFIIQCHNELRDLEADLLSMVCNDLEIEPQLQDVTGEQLSSGSNLAKEARLDIHACGFWEQHQSACFDIHVCHPNAESYKQLEPKHENKKKCSYTRGVLDIEHGSFTSLVFTSTGGMGLECLRIHSRLAELIANKKGEHYSRTMPVDKGQNFLCFIEICSDLLNPFTPTGSPFDK